MKMNLVLIVSLLTVIVYGRSGFGPTEQEWGYVTVRDGVHLFWWLHHTSADVESYTERPLVIWLQGGPGGSSTGYGNFAELGPLDADLNPRNTTWIKDVNVLFVDNPVGCGFSYADSLSLLTTNNRQIAKDFLVLIQGFYEAVPDLKSTPLYIFCESYGGKMTPEIALLINEAIENGTLDINLAGIGLGDSWISPGDSIVTYAPYLFNVGVIDQNGFEQIVAATGEMKTAIDNKDFVEAATLWDYRVANLISFLTYGMDFYNILKKIPLDQKISFRKWIKSGLGDGEDMKIDIIMNTKVKEALGLNVTWGVQSDAVYEALFGDIMTSVTDIVEVLLNSTNIKVGIYSGQLDFLVGIPGTMRWVDKLQFNGSEKWKSADRNPMVVNNIIEGYYKKVGNLAMYWVDRSGHMVPADNPAGMDFILSDLTNGFAKKIKN